MLWFASAIRVCALSTLARVLILLALSEVMVGPLGSFSSSLSLKNTVGYPLITFLTLLILSEAPEDWGSFEDMGLLAGFSPLCMRALPYPPFGLRT